MWKSLESTLSEISQNIFSFMVPSEHSIFNFKGDAFQRNLGRNIYQAWARFTAYKKARQQTSFRHSTFFQPLVSTPQMMEASNIVQRINPTYLNLLKITLFFTVISVLVMTLTAFLCKFFGRHKQRYDAGRRKHEPRTNKGVMKSIFKKMQTVMEKWKQVCLFVSLFFCHFLWKSRRYTRFLDKGLSTSTNLKHKIKQKRSKSLHSRDYRKKILTDAKNTSSCSPESIRTPRSRLSKSSHILSSGSSFQSAALRAQTQLGMFPPKSTLNDEENLLSYNSVRQMVTGNKKPGHGQARQTISNGDYYNENRSYIGQYNLRPAFAKCSILSPKVDIKLSNIPDTDIPSPMSFHLQRTRNKFCKKRSAYTKTRRKKLPTTLSKRAYTNFMGKEPYASQTYSPTSVKPSQGFFSINKLYSFADVLESLSKSTSLSSIKLDAFNRNKIMGDREIFYAKTSTSSALNEVDKNKDVKRNIETGLKPAYTTFSTCKPTAVEILDSRSRSPLKGILKSELYETESKISKKTTNERKGIQRTVSFDRIQDDFEDKMTIQNTDRKEDALKKSDSACAIISQDTENLSNVFQLSPRAQNRKRHESKVPLPLRLRNTSEKKSFGLSKKKNLEEAEKIHMVESLSPMTDIHACSGDFERTASLLPNTGTEKLSRRSKTHKLDGISRDKKDEIIDIERNLSLLSGGSQKLYKKPESHRKKWIVYPKSSGVKSPERPKKKRADEETSSNKDKDSFSNSLSFMRQAKRLQKSSIKNLEKPIEIIIKRELDMDNEKDKDEANIQNEILAKTYKEEVKDDSLASDYKKSNKLEKEKKDNSKHISISENIQDMDKNRKSKRISSPTITDKYLDIPNERLPKQKRHPKDQSNRPISDDDDTTCRADDHWANLKATLKDIYKETKVDESGTERNREVQETPQATESTPLIHSPSKIQKLILNSKDPIRNTILLCKAGLVTSYQDYQSNSVREQGTGSVTSSKRQKGHRGATSLMQFLEQIEKDQPQNDKKKRTKKKKKTKEEKKTKAIEKKATPQATTEINIKTEIENNPDLIKRLLSIETIKVDSESDLLSKQLSASSSDQRISSDLLRKVSAWDCLVQKCSPSPSFKSILQTGDAQNPALKDEDTHTPIHSEKKKKKVSPKKKRKLSKIPVLSKLRKRRSQKEEKLKVVTDKHLSRKTKKLPVLQKKNAEKVTSNNASLSKQNKSGKPRAVWNTVSKPIVSINTQVPQQNAMERPASASKVREMGLKRKRLSPAAKTTELELFINKPPKHLNLSPIANPIEEKETIKRKNKPKSKSLNIKEKFNMNCIAKSKSPSAFESRTSIDEDKSEYIKKQEKKIDKNDFISEAQHSFYNKPSRDSRDINCLSSASKEFFSPVSSPIQQKIIKLSDEPHLSPVMETLEVSSPDFKGPNTVPSLTKVLSSTRKSESIVLIHKTSKTSIKSPRSPKVNFSASFEAKNSPKSDKIVKEDLINFVHNLEKRPQHLSQETTEFSSDWQTHITFGKNIMPEAQETLTETTEPQQMQEDNNANIEEVSTDNNQEHISAFKPYIPSPNVFKDEINLNVFHENTTSCENQYGVVHTEDEQEKLITETENDGELAFEESHPHPAPPILRSPSGKTEIAVKPEVEKVEGFNQVLGSLSRLSNNLVTSLNTNDRLPSEKTEEEALNWKTTMVFKKPIQVNTTKSVKELKRRGPPNLKTAARRNSLTVAEKINVPTATKSNVKPKDAKPTESQPLLKGNRLPSKSNRLSKQKYQPLKAQADGTIGLVAHLDKQNGDENAIKSCLASKAAKPDGKSRTVNNKNIRTVRFNSKQPFVQLNTKGQTHGMTVKVNDQQETPNELKIITEPENVVLENVPVSKNTSGDFQNLLDQVKHRSDLLKSGTVPKLTGLVLDKGGSGHSIHSVQPSLSAQSSSHSVKSTTSNQPGISKLKRTRSEARIPKFPKQIKKSIFNSLTSIRKESGIPKKTKPLPKTPVIDTGTALLSSICTSAKETTQNSQESESSKELFIPKDITEGKEDLALSTNSTKNPNSTLVSEIKAGMDSTDETTSGKRNVETFSSETQPIDLSTKRTSLFSSTIASSENKPVVTTETSAFDSGFSFEIQACTKIETPIETVQNSENYKHPLSSHQKWIAQSNKITDPGVVDSGFERFGKQPAISNDDLSVPEEALVSIEHLRELQTQHNQTEEKDFRVINPVGYISRSIYNLQEESSHNLTGIISETKQSSQDYIDADSQEKNTGTELQSLDSLDEKQADQRMTGTPIPSHVPSCLSEETVVSLSVSEKINKNSYLRLRNQRKDSLSQHETDEKSKLGASQQSLEVIRTENAPLQESLTLEKTKNRDNDDKRILSSLKSSEELKRDLQDNILFQTKAISSMNVSLNDQQTISERNYSITFDESSSRELIDIPSFEKWSKQLDYESTEEDHLRKMRHRYESRSMGHPDHHMTSKEELRPVSSSSSFVIRSSVKNKKEKSKDDRVPIPRPKTRQSMNQKRPPVYVDRNERDKNYKNSSEIMERPVAKPRKTLMNEKTDDNSSLIEPTKVVCYTVEEAKKDTNGLQTDYNDLEVLLETEISKKTKPGKRSERKELFSSRLGKSEHKRPTRRASEPRESIHLREYNNHPRRNSCTPSRNVSDYSYGSSDASLGQQRERHSPQRKSKVRKRHVQKLDEFIRKTENRPGSDISLKKSEADEMSTLTYLTPTSDEDDHLTDYLNKQVEGCSSVSVHRRQKLKSNQAEKKRIERKNKKQISPRKESSEDFSRVKKNKTQKTSPKMKKDPPKGKWTHLSEESPRLRQNFNHDRGSNYHKENRNAICSQSEDCSSSSSDIVLSWVGSGSFTADDFSFDLPPMTFSGASMGRDDNSFGSPRTKSPNASSFKRDGKSNKNKFPSFSKVWKEDLEEERVMRRGRSYHGQQFNPNNSRFSKPREFHDTVTDYTSSAGGFLQTYIGDDISSFLNSRSSSRNENSRHSRLTQIHKDDNNQCFCNNKELSKRLMKRSSSNQSDLSSNDSFILSQKGNFRTYCKPSPQSRLPSSSPQIKVGRRYCFDSDPFRLGDVKSRGKLEAKRYQEKARKRNVASDSLSSKRCRTTSKARATDSKINTKRSKTSPKLVHLTPGLDADEESHIPDSLVCEVSDTEHWRSNYRNFGYGDTISIADVNTNISEATEKYRRNRSRTMDVESPKFFRLKRESQFEKRGNGNQNRSPGTRSQSGDEDKRRMISLEQHLSQANRAGCREHKNGDTQKDNSKSNSSQASINWYKPQSQSSTSPMHRHLSDEETTHAAVGLNTNTAHKSSHATDSLPQRKDSSIKDYRRRNEASKTSDTVTDTNKRVVFPERSKRDYSSESRTMNKNTKNSTRNLSESGRVEKDRASGNRYRHLSASSPRATNHKSPCTSSNTPRSLAERCIERSRFSEERRARRDKNEQDTQAVGRPPIGRAQKESNSLRRKNEAVVTKSVSRMIEIFEQKKC